MCRSAHTLPFRGAFTQNPNFNARSLRGIESSTDAWEKAGKLL
jgi:hypothetical protein